MKKISTVILILVIITFGENNIVKAVGAQDSNPNTELNGGTSKPILRPGEEIQQKEEEEKKKEEEEKKKEEAEKKKKYSDEEKKKFSAEEIIDYVNSLYKITQGTSQGSIGIIDESQEVIDTWHVTLKEAGYPKDGHDPNNSVYYGLSNSSTGKGDTIYKYPSRDDTGKNNSEQSLEDMVSDANSFINSGELKLNQDALSNFSQTMYNILLAIGVVVAVIVGAIIGIKLMTSSIEEKAEAKKLLVPYVVGCAVVFGGFGIWKIVVTILQHI